MAFEIAALPQSGGTFFKPEDHKNDIAILIEPKRLEADRPSKFGAKDAIHADLTVFKTQADLDAGTPSEVLKGCIIQSVYLVSDITALIGKATVSVPLKKQFKSGSSGWVWEAVAPEVVAKVAAYGTARDAAVAADMDDAPDF
jgi:hypothetical protein